MALLELLRFDVVTAFARQDIEDVIEFDRFLEERERDQAGERDETGRSKFPSTVSA